MCPFFTEHFGECVHVNKTSLPRPATDIEIWHFAKEHGYTIITQDADFLNLLETKGYPPKIILVKTGNISRTQMEAVILQAKPFVIELHSNNEYDLLEIM
jgi:predicted nuclease of predicted toxin-antitoxin system